ncbi:FtsX-like permease family protein [Jiangella alkaliphila]|uniref:FtsX-like permease family protein n=1 Tax=Jiangella alkaliphila TaxID=419479 RepID=A0A1H2LXB2_9ACTN|nr:FtsX-like permease family protein [Jiangella alkaliphila]SDU85643.1 FtsX-like permease family protein [Jiangella alkaliphila]
MTGRLRGHLVAVWRLALHSVLGRPGGAILMAVAIAASTFALTLALIVDDAAESPWDGTFAATAGPHAVVHALDPAALPAITTAAGVASVGGPFPMLRFDDVAGAGDVYVVGRDRTDPPVDRPVVTEGTWIADGGLVVERSFARARGLTVGDRLPIGPNGLEVVGIAVTSGWAAYPGHQPAMTWTTRAEAGALASAAGERRVVASLRLDDPAGAVAFARAYGATDDAGPQVVPWEQFRSASTADARTIRVVLVTGAVALAILTAAASVVLVSGRFAEQTERAAALAAVGASAGFGAFVVVTELLVLATAAVPLAVVAGELVAPVLAANAGDALETAGGPGIVGAQTGLAALGGLATALVAAVPAYVRGVRAGTNGALTGALAGAPSASGGAAAAVRAPARLPATAALGLRFAFRRPARALLPSAGLAVTVGMVVAALTLESTAAAGGLADGSYLLADLRRVTYGLVVALAGLAVVNGVLLAWSTALESRRTTQVLEALGATPRQTTTVLVVAQALPAAVAALVGIPLGMGLLRLLFQLNGGDAADVVAPPAGWLAAAVPATVLVTVLISAAAIRLTPSASGVSALGSP